MMRRATALPSYIFAPSRIRLRSLPPSTPHPPLFPSQPYLSRAFSAYNLPRPSNPPRPSSASLIAQARSAKHALVARLRSGREPADWTEERVFLSGDACVCPLYHPSHLPPTSRLTYAMSALSLHSRPPPPPLPPVTSTPCARRCMRPNTACGWRRALPLPSRHNSIPLLKRVLAATS
jgi:hypothetical protein